MIINKTDNNKTINNKIVIISIHMNINMIMKININKYKKMVIKQANLSGNKDIIKLYNNMRIYQESIIL